MKSKSMKRMVSIFLTFTFLAFNFLSVVNVKPVMAAGTSIISEGFDLVASSNPTPPSGWTFNASGSFANYTSNTNYGIASPSLSFKPATGGTSILTSKSFTLNNTAKLSFWMKGQSTAAGTSNFLVEKLNGSTWSKVAEWTGAGIPTSATVQKDYVLEQDTTQLRFTYKKAGGNLAFDDVTVIEDEIVSIVNVTGVSLSSNAESITVGKTKTLTATIEPANATNKAITWTTDNDKVATVNNGVVTAIAEGTANITVTTADNSRTASCLVTVVPPVAPQSVALNKATMLLKADTTEQLTATVSPVDADNKNVTWASSNEAIATVTADGSVKGIAEGKADITATTVVGGKIAKCAVTVYVGEDTTAPVITNLIPQNGSSTGNELKPVISAEYDDFSGVDPATVKLTVDGIDQTSKATITDTKITYTPAENLTNGKHDVTLEVSDVAAAHNKATAAWSFNVGEPVYKAYFGQLHSHTNLSDGAGSPTEAYDWAKDRAKLDFFAITDHSNWFDNEKDLANEKITKVSDSTSAEWKELRGLADTKNTDGSFVAIGGFEMTWSGSTGGYGHINTFNTDWFSSRSNNAMTLQAYYSKLAEPGNSNSLSQLNHPGTTFGDFSDFGLWSAAVDKVVNLVEVGNGEGPVRGSGYFPSYEYYTRALDKGWHVAPSNNQDNHKQEWGTANDARTVVLAEKLTRDDVYAAIKAKRVYATEDKNLNVSYTVNGKPMGSQFGTIDKLNIVIKANDPDATDKLSKISIIVDGGKVAYETTDPTALANAAANGLNLELPQQYSYYYVRIDQADRDITVTAPVWVGVAEKAGFSGTSASNPIPLKNEPLKITSTFFNNTVSEMKINELTYTVPDGAQLHTTSAAIAVASMGVGAYSFDYTPDKVGKMTINVRMAATLNGVDRTYNDTMILDVKDPALVTNVVIDGSHNNDYVYGGYYAGNMTNIITLANSQQVRIVIEKTKLTDEVLRNAKMLILSGPAKKPPTKAPFYDIKEYSAEDIAVIKRFADNGGNVIVTALADYQDNKNDAIHHSSTQQNMVLEAIGAGSRINDDEVVDYENNPNARAIPDKTGSYGTPYRIPMNVYNMSSPYLDGIVAAQNYSFYSGCSITMGQNATWLVKGTPTTYGFDADKDGKGGQYVADASKTTPAAIGIPKGDVVALAGEKLPGGGMLFIAGTSFYSNYEIKVDLDNGGQLQNSNYNITMNILNSVKNTVKVSTIAEARAAQKGEIFTVEGIVTSGSEKSDNKFFDVIYIQDATGGMTLFPISAEGIKVGQKLQATGYIDVYCGDKELQVSEYKVIDTAVAPISPTLLSTGDSMLLKNSGLLVKVVGKVTEIKSGNIFLNDGSGVSRIFVEGYIGDGSGDAAKLGKWDPKIAVGDVVTAVGLASIDPEGARLRVRNTSEIVRQEDKIAPVITVLGVTDGGSYIGSATPAITVDKGTFTATLNGNAYTDGTTIKTSGSYTLVVNAMNNDGYKSSKTVKFTIKQAVPTSFTLTVVNGKGTGTYKTSATATATAILDGKKFAGWKDEKGNIVSYKSAYSFRITRNITLEAVLTEAEVKAVPAATVDSNVIYDTTNKDVVKMNVLGVFTLPSEYKLIECGFVSLKTTDEAAGSKVELATKDVKVVKAAYTEEKDGQKVLVSKLNEAGQVYRVINTTYGSTFFIRGYMTFEGPDGIQTIYSMNYAQAYQQK